MMPDNNGQNPTDATVPTAAPVDPMAMPATNPVTPVSDPANPGMGVPVQAPVEAPVVPEATPMSGEIPTEGGEQNNGGAMGGNPTGAV